ncbi:hypothetical protein ACF1BQ_005190 [Bradyrhizobium sp. RDT10]
MRMLLSLLAVVTMIGAMQPAVGQVNMQYSGRYGGQYGGQFSGQYSGQYYGRGAAIRPLRQTRWTESSIFWAIQ